MDKDLQAVGMILEDVETTAAYQYTRLLFGNLPDGDGLCLKERMRSLILLLTVVLSLVHITAIEVGKVVAP